MPVPVYRWDREQGSTSLAALRLAGRRHHLSRHLGPLDVTLADWRAAGLLKPSVARLDRIVTAERTVFLRRLGTLSPDDLRAVRDTWNQRMRL